jgi:hypothetical protein
MNTNSIDIPKLELNVNTKMKKQSHQSQFTEQGQV